MALEGFGSELSLTAILMIIVKALSDIYMKRREKQRVVEVVNSSGGNPAKGNPAKDATSMDLILYKVKENCKKLDTHSVELKELGKDMTAVKVNLGKINTKLDID